MRSLAVKDQSVAALENYSVYDNPMLRTATDVSTKQTTVSVPVSNFAIE